MITIRSNIASVVIQIAEALREAIEPERLTHVVAQSMLPVIAKRIHVDGQAADGSEIGTYTEEYMRVRTGQFLTNSRFSKGKNKGQTKPTGVFTKGKNKGAPRPNYNRFDDPKVILSLTSAMEQDFTPQVGDSGNWGLGFNNEQNLLKAQYNNERYGKIVYDLTDDEKKLSAWYAEEWLKQKLSDAKVA